LAAPALGANFVQILLDLQPGGGVHQPEEDRTETFIYVLSGGVEVTLTNHRVIVAAGGFAFAPASTDYEVRAPIASTLLLLRKRFEPLSGVLKPEPFTGNVSNVAQEDWPARAQVRSQPLMPDEMSFDMAINLMTIAPGEGLPLGQTQVMERGIYILEGTGACTLGDEPADVQSGDFLWTAPFCPFGLSATGTTPLKVLHYQNVNRDIAV
jgi:(S)-ureidoglycine aminohydrolase